VSEVQQQRRGRRIAMTTEEVDAFLREQRTCRVGTVGPGGRPHVSPLWFGWDGDALWLYSVTRSRRWADLQRNPAVSVVVDAGDGFFELCGVELIGDVEFVGESPRVGEENRELVEPEAMFATKYFEGGGFVYDGRHAWVRLRPAKVVSWDFRKIV
jgi:PPOX class probable F420-dependent enzyme